ncbi:MAG: TraR/DksA family transcriptional regulator [Pirellulaceae bacterium]
MAATFERDKIRQQLEALRRRVRSDVDSVADQALAPPTGQRGGELSNAPFHLADGGTEEFLAEMNTTLLENASYIAGEVQHALARLDDGTFGQCEQCGEPIHAERLAALPYARLCIHCAEQTQDGFRANLDRGRPRTPDDTLAPEGNMSEDSTALEIKTGARRDDRHAAGTAGGGTAHGGLAGTNIGRGDPSVADVQDATGSSEHEHRDSSDR